MNESEKQAWDETIDYKDALIAHEARWKRYLFAVLTAVAYNEGTLFTHDWKLTDEEKDEILTAYRTRGK